MGRSMPPAAAHHAASRFGVTFRFRHWRPRVVERLGQSLSAAAPCRLRIAAPATLTRTRRGTPGGLARPGLALAVCLGAFASLAHGQIELQRLFPPVIRAGDTSRVTAEGKFPDWPPKVVSEREDLQWDAAESSEGSQPATHWDVSCPEHTTPGVTWVRLADDRSASSLTPLVVTSAAITEEREPNDRRQDAAMLELPTVVAGRLQKRGDSDAYRIPLQAGQRLVASVTANELLASPMDAVLQLTDTHGNVLRQSDDVRGLDPQIVYTAESDSEYLLRLFAFPETPNSTVGFAGGEDYVYLIHVTTGPFLDHAADSPHSVAAYGYGLDQPLELQPQAFDGLSARVVADESALGWAWLPPVGDDETHVIFGESFTSRVPMTISGHFREPGQIHAVTVSLESGKRYRVESRSKADGFLVDSRIEVLDPKTDEILASNDDLSRGGYDAGVTFAPKSGGDYVVRVVDLLRGHGPRHFFRLSIRELLPRVEVTVQAGRFQLSPGEPLEIPVAINRADGFDRPLQVRAEGLPAGVVCPPVISQASGETAKSVTLRLEAEDAAPAAGHCQLLATPLDEDEQPAGESTRVTFALRPNLSLSQFWLAVAPPATEQD